MVSTQVLGRQEAEEFREHHHFGDGPLGDLVGIIERTTGHDVAIINAPPEEHGLTMTDPQRGVTFIAVAASDNPMRQRSSLAHELCHVLNQDGEIEVQQGGNGRRPAAERKADAFARHLLIPRRAIERVMEEHGGEPWTEASLSDLVRTFLVSPAIAAIALHEAGAIPDDLKQQWMRVWTPELAARHGWSDYYAALQEESRRARPGASSLASSRAIDWALSPRSNSRRFEACRPSGSSPNWRAPACARSPPIPSGHPLTASLTSPRISRRLMRFWATGRGNEPTCHHRCWPKPQLLRRA